MYLRNMVCFGCKIVNFLQKGEKDSNNNNNNNNYRQMYEEGDVTVLWNQAVHTDGEVNVLLTVHHAVILGNCPT